MYLGERASERERERERESERERGTTNGGVYLKYTERGLGKKLKRERQKI